MSRQFRIRVAMVASGMLLLAGCASTPLSMPIHLAEAPPAALPSPPPPPERPAELPVSLIVPPVGADGAYLTPNHALAPAEAVWHVRSALNVAALSCRGPQETALIAAYNAMLRGRKAALAVAIKAVDTRYKAERGKTWQTAEDVEMTRVYNFFAQPWAKQRFCALAAEIVEQANGGAAADFPAFAVTALARLEAPFTDVFRVYDGYRRDLAAWRASYAPAAETADSSGIAEAPSTYPAETTTLAGLNRR